MAIKNVQLPNGDTYDLGAKGSNVILNNYTQNSGYVSTDDDVVTAIGKIEGKSIASDDNLSSSISIVNDKTLVNSSAVYDNSLDAKKLIANRLFKTYGKPPWSTTINNTPNVQCGFDSLWLNDTGFDKKGYELIDSGMVYCNDGTVTSIDELTLDNVDGTHILQTNSNNQPIVDSGYGVQAVGYAKVRVPGNIYYSSSYEQVDIDTKRVATNSKTWTGLADFTGSSIWTDGDNIYYSNSSIQYVLDKSTSTWSTKTWTGLTNFRGPNIWTDGDNIYYSYSSTQYVLDKSTSTWSTKTWSGLTSFRGDYIWSDGTNIYYSSGSTQYVLDKSTSTWSTKTWAGLTNFSGQYIWSDGDNIYYSDSNTHRVLDKSTSTWSAKTWTGLTSFTGSNIWTDGDNIYYSNGSTQYILDKSTSTWSTKTWTGLADFTGSNIWTDGDNIYYSSGSNQYVLDKSTSTWSTKTWTGLTCFEGQCIWSDGDNIYYSYSSTQYVLDKSTSTWSTKTWTGLTNFRGPFLWTDGDNIYYSKGSTQYILDKSTSTWSTKTWTGLTSFDGSNIWTFEGVIFYSTNTTHYILDKSTSTWSQMYFAGSLPSFNGYDIWSDGSNTYYSSYSDQYILESEKIMEDWVIYTWSTKTWSGLTSFSGQQIWTDGDNIYYSQGSTQYVLNKSTSTWSAITWTGLSRFDGSLVWSDNITDDSVITIYSDDLGGKSSELPTSASGATMSNEQLTSIVHDGVSHGAASIPMGAVDNTSTSTAFTATVPGITALFDGVCVWLTNGVVSSASGFTLNINGLGAKPVYMSFSAATAATTHFNISYTILLVYNSSRVTGGCWDYVVGYNTNTEYTLPKLGIGYASCSTAASTAAKTASLSNYVLNTGGLVSINFTNDVNANATLNINSTGAKDIYYKGAKVTDGIIKAGDTVLFVYSTRYHIVSIDRWGSSFLSLSGGTINGAIKYQTAYNSALANNGVSSGIKYPTTFNITDVNDKIMARLEAQVNSDGNIGSKWYVRNCDSEGTQLSSKGISMTMSKTGALTYAVDEGVAFRTAIGAGTSNLTLGTTSTTALAGNTTYAGSSTAGGAATSANKLNTNAGSATKPVYFSGGVPVATTAPGAGAWFSSFTGNISSSGVLEVGRYLDFHSTNTGTTDYDIRLDASSTSLLTMTSSSGTPQLRLSGTLPRLRFTQTTSGKAYDNVLCGISAYPGNTAGVNLVIQSGGNTFIGGGESPASLYTRIITTDSNPYGTSSLEASEQMFITADNNIYFVSGAGSISATAYTDWTDLKTAIFDSAGSFKPSVNKKGSIGASSYQWGTAYINTVTIDNSCTLSYNSSTQSLDFIFS